MTEEAEEEVSSKETNTRLATVCFTNTITEFNIVYITNIAILTVT